MALLQKKNSETKKRSCYERLKMERGQFDPFGNDDNDDVD